MQFSLIQQYENNDGQGKEQNKRESAIQKLCEF